MTRTRKLTQGETLFNEGDPARSLFIIRTGTIAIRKRRGSVYVELGKVFSNEVIGEVAFFDRKPRSASAVALRATEVIELPFDALDKVYSEFPSYFRTIIAALADRLRKADDALKRLQTETVTESGKSAGTDSSGENDTASILAATADILDGSKSLADMEKAFDQAVDPELEAELLGTSGSGGDGTKD